MRRGEVWWAHLPPPQGARPVLLVSRDKALQVRALVTVAGITTRIRGLAAEVALTPEDGMPKACVVNADVLLTIEKAFLQRRICELPGAKMQEVARALKFALGLD